MLSMIADSRGKSSVIWLVDAELHRRGKAKLIYSAPNTVKSKAMQDRRIREVFFFGSSLVIKADLSMRMMWQMGDGLGLDR